MLCLSKKRKCFKCGLLFCWEKIVSGAKKHIQGFSFTRILPILVLASGLGAFFILGGAEYLAFETFRDNREFLLDFVERNGVAAVLAYMAVYAMAGYLAPYPTRGEISKHVAGSFFTPKLFGHGTRALVQFFGRFG